MDPTLFYVAFCEKDKINSFSQLRDSTTSKTEKEREIKGGRGMPCIRVMIEGREMEGGGGGEERERGMGGR